MGRLVGRGHDVHVLCADTVVAGAEPADPDHERRVTRSLRLYHSGEELLRPSWPDRLRIERHNQRALADALERHRPDVVSVWQLAGASFGLARTRTRLNSSPQSASRITTSALKKKKYNRRDH